MGPCYHEECLSVGRTDEEQTIRIYMERQAVRCCRHSRQSMERGRRMHYVKGGEGKLY